MAKTGETQGRRALDQQEGPAQDTVGSLDPWQEAFLDVDDEQSPVAGGQAVGECHVWNRFGANEDAEEPQPGDESARQSMECRAWFGYDTIGSRPVEGRSPGFFRPTIGSAPPRHPDGSRHSWPTSPDSWSSSAT